MAFLIERLMGWQDEGRVWKRGRAVVRIVDTALIGLQQARGLATIGDAQALASLSKAHVDAVRRQPDLESDFLRRATARHEAEDLALSIGEGRDHGRLSPKGRSPN